MLLISFSYFEFASVGSRGVVADPRFHFLASGLPILEVLGLSLYCQKKYSCNETLLLLHVLQPFQSPHLPSTGAGVEVTLVLVLSYGKASKYFHLLPGCPESSPVLGAVAVELDHHDIGLAGHLARHVGAALLVHQHARVPVDHLHPVVHTPARLLHVEVGERQLDNGPSGNGQPGLSVLVVRVVGRVVGRLDGSTGATRTIATSASAEKILSH